MSKKNRRKEKTNSSGAADRPTRKGKFGRSALVAAAVVVVLIVIVVALRGGSSRTRDLSAHPSKGPANAKVTIIEYGDFQCPACKKAQEPLKKMLSAFPNDVRLEFHNFPLILNHPLSLKAAEVAQCAFDQGKFWEMHDLLYENQEIWPKSPDAMSLFKSYAKQIGLDGNRFDACASGDIKRETVMADLEQGEARRINSTPTFFVNGTRVVGIPSVEYFIDVVKDALTKAGG